MPRKRHVRRPTSPRFAHSLPGGRAANSGACGNLLLSGVRQPLQPAARAPILGLLPHQLPSHNPRTRVARQARPPPFNRKRAASRQGRHRGPRKAGLLHVHSPHHSPSRCPYGARLFATAKPDSTPEARQAMLFIRAQKRAPARPASARLESPEADDRRYRSLTVNPLRGGGAGQLHSWLFAHGAFQITFRGYRRAARAACPPGQVLPRFVRYPSPAAAPRQAARAATLLLSGVRRVAFARRRALPCPGLLPHQLPHTVRERAPRNNRIRFLTPEARRLASRESMGPR